MAINATTFLRTGTELFRAQVRTAPLKQWFSLSLLAMKAGHFRAHMSAAPLDRRFMATRLEEERKNPQR